MTDVSHAGVPSEGALVLLVGPSGAGKDTLLGFARRHLGEDPRYVFARRLIARTTADPSEDYESCTEEAFKQAEAAGNLALIWRAHGTAYGIRNSILPEITRGCVVIASVSRGVIGAGVLLARRTTVALFRLDVGNRLRP